MTRKEAIEYGKICLESWKKYAKTDSRPAEFFTLAVEALEELDRTKEKAND